MLVKDGNTVGLVEFTGHLGQQFVVCHANGASQTCVIRDGFLNQTCQGLAAIALTTWDVGEVDVNLIHTSVFHHGRNFSHDTFKSVGIVTVLRKIDRQQNGVRAELGRFHDPHGRTHTKSPRCIGGGGDDTTAGVALQTRKYLERNFRQVSRGPFTFSLQDAHTPQQIIFTPTSTAYDYRQALELGVAQQLHRCVKRIHVQMGNAA